MLAILGAVALLVLLLVVAGRSWGVGFIAAGSPPRFGAPDVPEGVRSVQVEHAGAEIHAWVVDPDGPPRGTVFVLHGIRDSKRSQLETAQRLAHKGFRAVAVDLRCHGESSGEWLSYGVRESQDVVALADDLARRGLLHEPMGVVGFSYGAATAIQVGARDPRVRAVVAIAPFASLREVVPAYVDWMLGPLAAGVPASWLTEMVDEAGEMAGFDPDEACPRCVASRLQAPLLLIHSRDDERIPFAHTEAVRAACASPAELMALDGPDHNATPAAPGVAQAVDAWLVRHLTDGPPR
jgi:alpha-beta hydrolase superfamily lysophospholipase